MALTLSNARRLERVMRGQPVDRVPVRLWGVDPLRPVERTCWQPLHDLAEEFELDHIVEWEPLPLPGIPATGGYLPVGAGTDLDVRIEKRDTADPEWYETLCAIRTPTGEITRVDAYHRGGRPGYTVKHPVETPEDARRWLSIPDPELPSLGPFFRLAADLGDRGMVMTMLSQGVWSVNDAVGSELWAYWLCDERELLHEMVSKVQHSILIQVKRYLAGRVGPLFGWAGPEFCIPPLAAPRDFEDFCFDYDKPVIDLVHDAGGLVWVHCHGDMDPVIERFVEMGVDCLNPMEPPPVGRLTLADAKRRVRGRMTLEGGVEIGDLELNSPEEIAATVVQVMQMGMPGGRFILCPSSQHQLWPDMSPRIADNYRTFVMTAMEAAEY